MIRILTVIGARPQFIKASALSKVWKDKFSDTVQEDLLHTGQHYDENMSQIFFEEMQIPRPRYTLSLSGSSEQQLNQMLEGINNILIQNKYDVVIVYGDTNSTLAGAKCADQTNVPLVHIEAGLRSYNLSMPEERNRIQTDKLSQLLFCPTQTAIDNLKAEDFPLELNQETILCGDIMYDCVQNFIELAPKIEEIRQNHTIDADYILSTIHRDFNTDNSENLSSILNALIQISEIEQKQIVLPLHPRTKKMIQQGSFLKNYSLQHVFDKLHFIPPVSYLEMIQLEKNAAWIITDSGGVQKESYFFGKKCLVVRPQTEWVEIIQEKAAVLGHGSTQDILEAYKELKRLPEPSFKPIFGNGDTAEIIADKIHSVFS